MSTSTEWAVMLFFAFTYNMFRSFMFYFPLVSLVELRYISFGLTVFVKSRFQHLGFTGSEQKLFQLIFSLSFSFLLIWCCDHMLKRHNYECSWLTPSPNRDQPPPEIGVSCMRYFLSRPKLSTEKEVVNNLNSCFCLNFN